LCIAREGLYSANLGKEAHITRIEAKFKLSQREDSENITAAVTEIDASGNRSLAEMMRRYNRSAIKKPVSARADS
jgi:predicted FMN-binding regulatory protein PaiB